MPKKAAKKTAKKAAKKTTAVAAPKGRGGKRTGAGRPVGSGRFSCPTKAMRLPVHLEDDIKAFVDKKIKAEGKAK